MKFDTLRFIGSSTVDLPIVGLDSSGPFVFKGAEGLGPTDVEVLYENKISEGGIRQVKRAINRQIVARVGLQPAWNVGQTPDELRGVVYRLLTTKFDQQVVFQILQNGSVLGVAKGDVSKLEASIFTKDPEVQITLDCDYPYFLAPALLVQTPSRTLSGAQQLIDIDNDGDAPAGFVMTFTLQSTNPAGLIISDDAPANGQFMHLGTGWAVGDRVWVDTRADVRGVWRMPAGSSTWVSHLNYLRGDSTWLQLHAGDNRFRVNITAFDWYGDAFRHTPAYWGV